MTTMSESNSITAKSESTITTSTVTESNSITAGSTSTDAESNSIAANVVGPVEETKSEFSSVVANSKLSMIERQVQIAQEFLVLAVKVGGLAFGGFVRDWIVRHQQFKDLDLWFKTRDQANAFISSLFKMQNPNESTTEDFLLGRTSELNAAKNMKYFIFPFNDNSEKDKSSMPEKYSGPFEFKNDQKGSEYNFERMKVNVFDNDNKGNDVKGNDKIVLMLDIIVSPTFPTNDFDVNSLTWDGKRLDCGFSGSANSPSMGIGSVDEIVAKIKRGEATMLPGYSELVDIKCHPHHYWRVDNFIRRKVFTITNFTFPVMTDGEEMTDTKEMTNTKKRKHSAIASAESSAESSIESSKEEKDFKAVKCCKVSSETKSKSCSCNCESCNCSNNSSDPCPCSCTTCCCSRLMMGVITSSSSSSSSTGGESSEAKSKSCCCGCETCNCSTNSSGPCVCSCTSCCSNLSASSSTFSSMKKSSEVAKEKNSELAEAKNKSCCCNCNECVCSSSSSIPCPCHCTSCSCHKATESKSCCCGCGDCNCHDGGDCRCSCDSCICRHSLAEKKE